MAACHLLLECTTFPVYLSEEETHKLYTKMTLDPGERRMMLPRRWDSLLVLRRCDVGGGLLSFIYLFIYCICHYLCSGG